METQNYSHYKDTEFSSWAYRNQLTQAEQFLTGKFLSKEQSTLEAGTGGGCILHCLRESGFGQLHGFDFLPDFIRVAKERDASGKIGFVVADAAKLPYADNCFSQAIYLQQILCIIEDATKRQQAMEELSRVLKPDGIALFSFLSYESRARQKSYRAFLAYLKAFRLVSGSSISIQLQPWLRHDNGFNPSAILDKPPYVYWYKIQEAVEMLERYGFDVIAAASEREARREITISHQELQSNDMRGMLYLVARKRK